MQLKILTPSQTLYDSVSKGVSVSQVIFDSSEGKMGVLDQHCSLIASLSPGKISVESSGEWQDFPSSSGLVEVHQNNVLILMES